MTTGHFGASLQGATQGGGKGHSGLGTGHTHLKPCGVVRVRERRSLCEGDVVAAEDLRHADTVLYRREPWQ